MHRRLSVYVTVVPLSKRINAHHATLICLRLPGHAGPRGVGDSVCPALPPHVVPLSSPERASIFTDYLVTGFSVEVLAPPASPDNCGSRIKRKSKENHANNFITLLPILISRRLRNHQLKNQVPARLALGIPDPSESFSHSPSLSSVEDRRFFFLRPSPPPPLGALSPLLVSAAVRKEKAGPDVRARCRRGISRVIIPRPVSQ